MTVQYLIDSENVGDFWIPLLELPGQETELIVFYTRNSPHMSYDSLIRLKESERTVTFIKCYEGTNALDFQLVSELGYRISKNEDGSFIIVTNDTGFDAAVKYWRRRKKSVKRITGKECKNLERRLREDLSAGTQQTRSANVSARIITAAERDAEEAQAEALRQEEVQDNDARPSRPNLRDAERAAQPEPEESFPAEDADYEADADVYDDDGDDAFAYDPDAEDTDDTAYDNEEDDLQDDDEYEIEPEENGDDELSASVREDVFDAEEDEDNPEESQADTEMMAAGEETEAGEENAFPEDEENVSSENDTDDAHSGTEDISEEHTAEGAADEESAAEDLTDLDPEAVSAQDAQAAADDITSQDTDSADAAAEIPAADTVIADSDDTPEEESQDAAFGAAQEENAAPEEEPAAETAHRSKSRRSRSRRSKSTARKQEQTAAAADSDESAEAADGAMAKEASEPADGAAAADNDSRKNDTAKGDANASRGNSSDALPAPGDEEIARIVACIGAENLAELHNQLATFYGEQGKDIYLSIKNNTRSIPALKPDLKQKFEYYCEIIFSRSDYAGEYPSDISEYLLNVRDKLNNLTSLRYALQKHSGKEKGRRFYFLLKPFAKTMYQM